MMTNYGGYLAVSLAVGGLVVYEVVAFLFNWQLISTAFWTFNHSKWGPIVPLLIGILLGHLFWSGE